MIFFVEVNIQVKEFSKGLLKLLTTMTMPTTDKLKKECKI